MQDASMILLGVGILSFLPSFDITWHVVTQRRELPKKTKTLEE